MSNIAHRKIEHPSEERKKLLEEYERNEAKLRYHKNLLKTLEHEEKGLLRKQRNHRIFTRGGMLEAFLQKPLLLSDEQVHDLLTLAFRQPETDKALRGLIEATERRIEEGDNEETTRKD